MRESVPRTVHSAEIIDGSNSLDCLDVMQLVEPRMHADACIVDESIDLSEFRDRTIDQSVALVAAGYIGGNPNSLGAKCATFFRCGGKQIGASRGKNESRALTRQELCHLETDACRRTGDDYNVVLENRIGHGRRM